MLELTKKNFDDEVVKQGTIIIIDFWADWCVDPSTEIISLNNTKSAREIKKGDHLLTYNGKDLVYDSVKKSFTSNMLGHCKEITTETGRKIKVTGEHEFLTPIGWKKAEQLKKNDKVAIMPIYPNKNHVSVAKEILNRKKIEKEAIKLSKEKKLNYKSISRKLGISPGTVWGWVKENKKPTINYHKLKYPSWVKQYTKGLPEGLMWEEIKETKEIYLESVQKIAMENNHNFIANGFLAHNCGPCKAMAPIFEDLSKEIKNVIFAKVNVDQSPEIASKFGIMSIPTFLIFKSGKEVDRIIGSNPRSAFKTRIEAAVKK